MNGKICVSMVMCAALVGCSSAPGTPKQQGAVVGGATGAAVGAAVTKNRALGAVIGGAVGAAGGYVVGGKTGTLDRKDPNTPASAPNANMPTADANHDGFVTLDEIVDMKNAGISDEEMIRRIQATGLTFDLNADQRKFLADHGVSATVIGRLPEMNRSAEPVSAPQTNGDSVISR